MDTTLDPEAVNLAKAIRQVESGGDFKAQGKSGEHGAYQFTPATWDSLAQKYGVNAPLNQATPEQQNEVAYKKIKELKDSGMNVGQISSVWNAGEKNPNAYLDPNFKGVNKYGAHFDVPAYAKSVAGAYQTLKQGGQVGADPNNPSSVANVENQTVTPPQEEGAPSIGGFAGNVVKSGYNFGKGILSSLLHPVKTVETLANIPLGVGEMIGGKIAGGNVDTKATQTAKAVGNFYKDRYGGISNIAKSVYKDPVGVAADLSVLASGGGAIAGKLGEASDLARAAELTKIFPYGEAISPEAIAITKGTSGASKVASGLNKVAEVTNPITPIAKGVGLLGKAAESSGLYGLAKLTGKDMGTLQTVIDNPKAFSSSEIGTLTRESLGKEVGDALAAKSSALEETGAGYAPIRGGTTAVAVDPNYLANLLKENTGVEVVNGKLVTSAGAGIRDAGDLRALQNLYDNFQPAFAKGSLTPNEYLNFRADLGKLAKYGREFSSSKPLEGISSVMRGKTNAALRGQIPGLEELDAKFAPQIEEYNRLKQNFIDKNGNLSEAATNKIANARGVGKDKLLSRLEEISPGITKKIQAVKALEDIKNIHKVGTYTRSALEGGGLIGGIATGNPALIAASVATMFLSNPTIAVRLLRSYGNASEIAGKVLELLRVPAQRASTGLIGAQRFNAAAGVR